MLYLLVVIFAAVRYGSGPAVVASLLAFLSFDWFFVQPFHTFTVEDPGEWLALLMFLVTAGVTGQLTALLRARADEARRREHETATLAAATAAVAAQVDRDHALTEVLRRLGEIVSLESAGILVTGADPPALLARYGAQGEELSPVELEAVRYVATNGRSINWDEEGGHWRKALPGPEARGIYLPLALEDRLLGVLHLRPRDEHSPALHERRLIQALAGQATVVLERDRLARAELQARSLQEADRLKTALLSMVSHDFRSPLTSIKASVTGLLQEGAAYDPTTQRELLRGIDQETDRLNGMVGNILALSRLEADAWRPRREPTPIAELVGTALGSFSAEENRRVEVRLAPDLPEAELDPVQMVQVLRNLVDNALKYSPEEQPVVLSAFHTADRLVLEVLDRGIGLPLGEEQRVFAPFYRAPHLQESSVPGVGIGLAVCRGLVEAHQGTLTALRRPEGGTIFRIELPLMGEG
jgi:two-component system sensor histidine kinase KdpD